MKLPYLSRAFVRSFLSQLLRRPCLMQGFVVGAALATGAAASDGAYRINVTSTADRVYTRFSKEPYREHGKRYAIISAAPIAENPLAHPVNEPRLLAQLRAVLTSHGFRETGTGQNPEIALTVLYGRCHVLNPYTTGSIRQDAYDPPTVTAGEIEAKAVGTPGGSTNLIAAGAEKLFIAVFAYQFPASGKEKPKQLWRTIIKTDDPDEDLNQLSEKMLTAGAAYFDHPVDDPEVTFSSDLPEGHVKVGTPTEVKPRKGE